MPGFTSSGWSILVAPQGTPAAIVQKINADLRTALARPEIVKKIEELGNYTRPMTPQELAEFVRERAQDVGADRQANRPARPQTMTMADQTSAARCDGAAPTPECRTATDSSSACSA